MRERKAILEEVEHRSQFNTRYDGPLHVKDKERLAEFCRIDATLTALLEVLLDIRDLQLDIKIQVSAEGFK